MELLVTVMADENLDFSELFPVVDDDDGDHDNMCYIDFQTVMKILDEDCHPVEEVGFLRISK